MFISVFRKAAFTLAEVLIVLGIIGVVAEMTIPTLMNNVQNAQYKSGAKKAYSVAAQAVMQMSADYGDDVANYYVNVSGSSYGFKTDFMKYFRVMQDCGATCYQSFKTLEGAACNSSHFDDGGFITADGMYWVINNDGSEPHIMITVDVNGYQKRPNVFGKDVYMFELTTNSTVIPEGATGTAFPSSSYCNKSATDQYQGLGCTSLVIQGTDYST